MLSSPVLTQPWLLVTWADGRLAVSAHNVRLAEVLREVARQTGVEFVGLERLTKPASLEFTDKSLADGLRLLLLEVDYLTALAPSIAAPTRPPARIFIFRASEPSARTREPTSSGQAAYTQPEPMVNEEPPLEDARDLELQQLEESGFFENANASALVDAADHKNPAVRIRAMEVLSQLNPSGAADIVARALTDANPAVSSSAAALIAENADPRAVEGLGELLKNNDPAVRFGAIQLLAQRSDADSLPYVRQATDDDNPAVRLVAIELVEQLERIRARR
jgi:hypothetical protein